MFFFPLATRLWPAALTSPTGHFYTQRMYPPPSDSWGRLDSLPAEWCQSPFLNPTHSTVPLAPTIGCPGDSPVSTHKPLALSRGVGLAFPKESFSKPVPVFSRGYPQDTLQDSLVQGFLPLAPRIWGRVSVISGGCDKIPQTGQLKLQIFIDHCLKPQVQDEGSVWSVVVRCLFLVLRPSVTFLLCPHMVRNRSGVSTS